MSKYLTAFTKATAATKDVMKLYGGLLIVEPIDDAEFKTKSGLIIASNDRQINGLTSDKPTFCRVLQVGEGYYGEGDVNGKMDHTPVDVTPGDIVLVPATALKRFSVFGRMVTGGDSQLALTSEESIQAKFNGQEGFDAYFAALNQGLESQVEQKQ